MSTDWIATPSLYTIRTELDKEYKDFLNDLIKLSTLYFTAVLLHCSFNPKPAKIIEQLGIEIYILLVLGLLAYHLVIRLVVVFV